ncbi:ribosome silencing factor [Myxococcota bacterium]
MKFEPSKHQRRTGGQRKPGGAPAAPRTDGVDGRRPGRAITVSRVDGAEESRRMALLAAEAGLDKKASEVEIIDVTGKVDYADYLVLMTGTSDRHVAAIAREVDALLDRNNVRAISVEGLPRASWVLLDFVSVVVHVFLADKRSLYDLGGLWMDAQRIAVSTSSSS